MKNDALDRFLRIGERVEVGSHLMTAEEIITFAEQFDPQPFHVDEKRAAQSLFGALCASGWHSLALWMRYSHASRPSDDPDSWQGDGPRPVFGPSPGFRNLRWLKPAYAGDTITFWRTAVSYRPLASRPGWIMLLVKAEASNQRGEAVFDMENSVLVNLDPRPET